MLMVCARAFKTLRRNIPIIGFICLFIYCAAVTKSASRRSCIGQLENSCVKVHVGLGLVLEEYSNIRSPAYSNIGIIYEYFVTIAKRR